MDKHALKAQKRDLTGRKVKNLRNEGFLPANVFGKKVKSLSVQVSTKDFVEVYKKAGETGIVSLEVEKEKEARPVLIYNMQVHPVTDSPLHVDFLQVDLKVKVTAHVPVELVGESPAEKQALGTVVQQIQEIEVEALPADLPEKFEIDKAELIEVDQLVKVADLKVDRSKVEIKTDAESIVVKVEPPQKEEVVEAPTAPVEGESAPVAEGGEQTATEAPKAEEKSSGQSQ